MDKQTSKYHVFVCNYCITNTYRPSLILKTLSRNLIMKIICISFSYAFPPHVHMSILACIELHAYI